jgi:hypothetical protein
MEFKDNEEMYEIVETSEIDYNQEYDSSRGNRIKTLNSEVIHFHVYLARLIKLI